MLYVNGLDAISFRVFQPWIGVWTIDADFNLATAPAVPSGPVTVKIGTSDVLIGTVDPSASGRFGATAKARIVGGSGGWQKRVSARQFHNDAGVTSLAVISATGAEIGERVTVLTPARLGVDFLRSAGPASRVLDGFDWHVDLTGATIVGPRILVPATPDVQVLSWDPEQQTAELASDSIVAPGTILTDTRFGTITVRDIEQTFSADGARGIAWCSSDAPAAAGGKLGALLATAVRNIGRTDTLRTYRYRVVSQGVDGRLSLQSVVKKIGVPDSIALPPWYGLPGVKSNVVPGTEAAVVFLNGDFAQPAVVAFNGKTTGIKIGEAPQPVALAPLVTAQLTALKAAVITAINACAPSGPAAATALAATLATWPGPIASTKLSSD